MNNEQQPCLAHDDVIRIVRECTAGIDSHIASIVLNCYADQLSQTASRFSDSQYVNAKDMLLVIANQMKSFASRLPD
jgi:type IV secretory pathway protease TraF